MPWRRSPGLATDRWSLAESALPREQWEPVTFDKVGKARAGRLLDGREWDEVPIT